MSKVSTTDSESGLFVKGEHERCFAQTACDKHGFVLAFEVGAGNLHDGQLFHELYKKMELSRTEVIAIDAGYKTPGVVREIFLSGKIPAVPYTRPKTKDGFFRKSEYVYDEYFDCYLCPQNQILKYTTTNREGYREYKSDPRICEHCLCRENCTLSKNKTKGTTSHIFVILTRNARRQSSEYLPTPKSVTAFATLIIAPWQKLKYKFLLFFPASI